MTGLRNTNLGVFVQCQYTRTILRNTKVGQNLFKKYSKFQNFNEIFRNVKLGVFRHKNYLKKYVRQKRFKKLSKFQKFQLRGHPFMTSTKNDQFFDSPTPTIRKNE